MPKQVIGTFYAVSVIIWAIAIIGLIASLQYYGTTSARLALDYQVGYSADEIARDQGTVDLARNEVIISIVGIVLAGISGMIAWVGTLVNLSRMQAWSWFILTFFFGGIMILIYLIGGPQLRQAGYALQGQPGSLAAPSNSSGVSPQAYQPPPSPSLSALEILQQRYARGEIDTLTFQQMREML